jgi:hypothetical protein
MKVAYILPTQGHTVSCKLGKMILPQREENAHGADVVGMFFFEDNNHIGLAGPLGPNTAPGIGRQAAMHCGRMNPGRRCRGNDLPYMLRLRHPARTHHGRK